MPVLVAPADTYPGALVVRRLLRDGGEIRAVSASGDGDLRRAGAIVARADPDDEGRVETAMVDAHTVVHLAVDPLAGSLEELTVAARTIVRAAANAGVKRVIALTITGADYHAADPLRRLAGTIEQAYLEAPIPTVMLRASLVDTPALRDALASRPWSPSQVALEVAPVRAGDVAEAVAHFDSLRSTAHEGHVVFHVDGPSRQPFGDFLSVIGALDSRVGRRFTPASEAPLLDHALAGPLVNDRDEVFDAWDFLGHRPAAPEGAGI